MDKNIIQAAFERHGSDKAQHGYAEFYARLLPESPRSILEIGVKDGASIRAWRELFPDAAIMGLDLFMEFPIPKDTGASFIKANQCDWLALERLREFNFDVIIDDGSHNARDQMISFFGLAHKGCHYFIEDAHCNFDEFYSQGLPMMWRAIYNVGTNYWESPSGSLISYIPC